LRQRVGESIAERKERELEPVQEQDQAREDEQRAAGQGIQMLERLLHDEKLEEDDDRHDGGEVAERSQDYARKTCHHSPEPRPPCRRGLEAPSQHGW
jgi:hypothetical protein